MKLTGTYSIPVILKQCSIVDGFADEMGFFNSSYQDLLLLCQSFG